jgi:Putative secretion activating protein
MSALTLAMPTIFLHEGRYNNRPTDPGGATNFGISLRFLLQTGDLDKDGLPDGDINIDGYVDINDIKAMDEASATRLYDLYWWSRYHYQDINDQQIATKLFSLAINMGAKPAHKCLQRATRSVSSTLIADDGLFGKATLELVNRVDPNNLLAAFKSEAAGYYRSIKYKGSEDYIKGWLNRAYSDLI